MDISLVENVIFGTNAQKAQANLAIWELAQKNCCIPSSIYQFYKARGKSEIPSNFVVPAVNIRCMTFDMAKALFRAAQKMNVGAFVVELARSEMDYTSQNPFEFSGVILAAALETNWDGPIFLQGDHYQAKTDAQGDLKQNDINEIKNLITESISCGIYNIDIDTSTLVHTAEHSVQKQQELNIKYTNELLDHIRKIEPDEITISVGGEIGHIGGKNSTVEDLVVFLDGIDDTNIGISKVSVQTGSSHGGVVDKGGHIQHMEIDFNVLKDITDICKDKYQIAGAVQHGASTLSDEQFREFTKTGAVEIHLATGFQNIILDHPEFPSELKQKMYEYIHEKFSHLKKEDQTDEQFIYKNRKRALGAHKKDFWELDDTTKEAISNSLEERFRTLFEIFNVTDTKDLVNECVTPVKIDKTEKDFAGFTLDITEDEIQEGAD